MPPAASPCPLEIAGLVKHYGSVPAVDGVDLAVPAGEVLALLGPSGCGKTTILHCVAGFVTPDRGDIRLDGASLLPVPPERRRAAMLFQHYALFPHMSVRDNVGFGLRMARVPKADAARRIDAALRLVRIEALADRRPAQLSGGQRQRVALARAVITEPRLLLLDEPLGALDQNLREMMQVELRKLQQRLGLTTVMVTHDRHEAIVLADRIAVMRDGKVEQLGTPLEIHDHPRTRFVAAFCGVENLLPVRPLEPGAVAVAGGVVQGLRPPEGGQPPTALAVRAEAIAIVPRAAGPGDIGGIVGFVQTLGAATRYEVTAGDLTVTVIEARRDTAPHAPGSAVVLALPPGRCTLLAD